MGKYFDELLKDKEEQISKIKRLQTFLNEQAMIPQDMREIDSSQYILLATEIEDRKKLLNTLSKRIKYDKEKKEKYDIH